MDRMDQMWWCEKTALRDGDRDADARHRRRRGLVERLAAALVPLYGATRLFIIIIVIVIIIFVFVFVVVVVPGGVVINSSRRL